MTVATGRHARCQSRNIRTSGGRNQKFKGFWRQIFKATFNPYQQHLDEYLKNLQSNDEVSRPKIWDFYLKRNWKVFASIKKKFQNDKSISATIPNHALLSLARAADNERPTVAWERFTTSNNLFSRTPRLWWLHPHWLTIRFGSGRRLS